MTDLRVASALLAAASLVVFLWARYRAQSRSDKQVPSLALLLVPVAILVGTLPRLLWPDARQIQNTASIVSMLLAALAVVVMVRQMLNSSKNQRAS